MKTLLGRARGLLDSTKDWYLGKEAELHRGHAEIAVEVVARLDALEARIVALEDDAGLRE